MLRMMPTRMLNEPRKHTDFISAQIQCRHVASHAADDNDGIAHDAAEWIIAHVAHAM